MSVFSKIEIVNTSISKDNLLQLLAGIMKERVLIAPVRNELLGDVNFLPVTDVGRICFEYDNTATSPKEFFFPQYECMFTFTGRSNDTIELKGNGEELVLFGARSCDVRGIELLDKFYQRNFEDNYYLDKRRKAAIISVACSELNDQCFCTATGTGPVLLDGFDIQLVDIEETYAVQVGSQKGLELFERFRSYFGPAAEIDVERLLRQAMEKPPRFSLEKVSASLTDEKPGEEFWKDMGLRCQGCGLCLFLCPTCSCFSVADRATPFGENRRARQWDACYFMGITTMAGGNNPVRTRADMMKRKYNHKLVQQIDEFGMSGCSGCGRCNLVCVGNVNWLENIIRIERGD